MKLRAIATSTTLCALLLAACETEPKPNSGESLEPSPNATITPSPLVAGGSLVAKTTKAPTPKPNTKKLATEPAEAPTPLAVQTAPSTDEVTPKQLTQVLLTGRLHWPAYPGTSKTSATLSKQLDVATKTQRQFEVNLRAHGRMQVTFYGNLFPFENGSSIESRIENYGHLLLWPDAQSYRVLPVGSIRTLLTEGRPDVTPIVHLDPEPHPGADMLERPTQVWTFETNRGKLHLQQAQLDEAELGGPLLCRFLLEWLSIAPTSTVCEPGLVPLHAEFESPRGAKLVWDTSELELKADPEVTKLAVPPREAQFRQYGIPEPEAVLTPSELGLLRKSGKTGTLTAHNPTAQVQWVLLDGAAIGRVAPSAAWTTTGVSQGTYFARLVDFFGIEARNQPGFVINEEATFGAPSAPQHEPEQ